jgi:hypothetical protein
MTKCETRKQLIFPTWYRHFPRKWWVKPGFTTVVNSSFTLTKRVGVGPFFPGLQDWDFLSSGIQDPGIPNSDFGKSELHFFKFRKSGFQVFKFWFSSSDPLLSPLFSICPLQKF